MNRWTVDPIHTDVQFKVKHLMINTVTGEFNDFDVKVETDNGDFVGAKVHFDARIDSINTKNEDRDNHLKSDDFFNAEKYPTMKFESTSMKRVDDGKYELTGMLTIREHTHPVTLDAEYGGTMEDPYGNTKAGFELSGKLSRKEFGLKWNAVTEAGGVVVSDEVRLHLNVQLVKTVEEAAVA